VRRELGCEAFGINWFELGPDVAGLQHDESESRQEEVLIVVAGSGHWEIDGETDPARMGSFLRVDPDTALLGSAAPEGRRQAPVLPSRIIPAATVSLVDSSMRMKLPVVRLRA
jgi:hypothetical protein